MNTVDNLVEKKLFVHPDWQQLLKVCDLGSFEDFWQIELDLVDDGNQGRGSGGWSHVGFYTLKADDNTACRIVIKRQQNYFSRTWQHPLKGVPTFLKEFDMLLFCRQRGVAVPDVIYCATRKFQGQQQAILVTSYLNECRPMSFIIDGDNREKIDKQHRPLYLRAAAKTVAMLHQSGIEHRCLYPKHLFVQKNGESCYLIDFEKARHVPQLKYFFIRDLERLARHCSRLPARDMITFLRAYLHQDHLGRKGKTLWRAIAGQVDRKNRQRHL